MLALQAPLANGGDDRAIAYLVLMLWGQSAAVAEVCGAF